MSLVFADQGAISYRRTQKCMVTKVLLKLKIAQSRGGRLLPKLRLFWFVFSRTSFMTRARLWWEGPPFRIRESSLLGLVVSQLVWAWSVDEKFNNYNANSIQLTIEWE